MSGKLIVIEGIDGCGKTTQTALLCERLESLGYAVFNTREPTDSDCGRLLRAVLSGDIKSDTHEMTILFSADRLWHNLSENGIKKHIENGEIVVCDRYYYSTFAYQGLDGDLDLCMHLNLDCPNIRKPDICIFLEMETDACLKRISDNRGADEIEIFENKTALDGIKNRFNFVFEKIKHNENIARIDADASISEVHERIFDEISKIL